MKKEDGAMPVMHAVAMMHMLRMLGIAKIMVALKIAGRNPCICRPAGRRIDKGAQAMADDKIFQKDVPVPDYLFGMHTWPIAVGYIYNP
jgi:hippurate hydrolase